MKQKRLLLGMFAFACLSINNHAWAGNETTSTVTFEDLTLESEQNWYGPADNAVDAVDQYGTSVKAGTFSSQNLSFSNVYTPSYNSWSGFAYTNATSNSGIDYTEMYNSAVGGGYGGKGVYAVCYNNGTITTPDTEGVTLSGCYLTNDAYAYACISNGNTFTKKFAQGDFFKMTFTADNGTSLDFYLADFRSENEANHYIVKDWTWCDFSSLGKVKTLSISFDSSDKGDYGINTPTFACIDNIGIVTTTDISSVHNSTPATTQRYDINGRAVNGNHKGLMMIRQTDGSVKKVFVK